MSNRKLRRCIGLAMALAFGFIGLSNVGAVCGNCMWHQMLVSFYTTNPNCFAYCAPSYSAETVRYEKIEKACQDGPHDPIYFVFCRLGAVHSWTCWT